MPEVIFILCENVDGFHGDTQYFLRYAIYNGKFVDTPSREDIEIVLDMFPNTPILMVVCPCRSCRRKGIKGPTEMWYMSRSESC